MSISERGVGGVLEDSGYNVLENLTYFTHVITNYIYQGLRFLLDAFRHIEQGN